LIWTEENPHDDGDQYGSAKDKRGFDLTIHLPFDAPAARTLAYHRFPKAAT
jgi:hypothetical protein